MKEIIDTNLVFNELLFELTCKLCNDNLDCIFNKLIDSKIDSKTLGFWIWDIIENKEYYSPKFRSTFGFNDSDDFPNVPGSWMSIIEPNDLKLALYNYSKHIDSKGIKPYSQTVTYNKKNGGKITVICHGKICSWSDGNPSIMIGVHMERGGYFYP